MKKLTQKQEAEKWQAVSNAFFRFVQRNPPEGFPMYNFILMGSSGLHEELIKLLDGFNPKEEKPCACEQEGKEKCGDGCCCNG